MPSTFPSVVATLSNPQATDKLNSPSHSALHQSENAEIVQMQTFIGTNASAVGTLIYDIRSPLSNGGGHVQTANKGGTGQTSYTKGDLLVSTSTSVLTKFAIGTDGNYLVADSTQAAGVRWGVGGAPTMRIYQHSVLGTSILTAWSKPSSLSYIKVQVSGGGGSSSGPGGGGAGGYGESVIPAAQLTASVLVMVGDNASGMSRFGSIIASGGVAGTSATGGAGGSVIGATLNIKGGKGVNGDTSESINGNGGSNPFGGGGPGAGENNGLDDAQNGIVVITEY